MGNTTMRALYVINSHCVAENM